MLAKKEARYKGVGICVAGGGGEGSCISIHVGSPLLS